MRSIFRSFVLILLLSHSLSASNKWTHYTESLGDFLQLLLPSVAALYSLANEDYQGLKELAIGYGTTLGIVYVSKYSLAAIAKKDPNLVRFAQRPNGSNFQGFPSGHTASAFSAVGFLQKRYGWRFGIPAALLATFVGYSRVQAHKHSTFQVVAGAMLGFGVSYLVASKYIDPSKHSISFDSTSDIRGRTKYSVRYAHYF